MNLYYYKAKVVSVYDGDTITCDIELGFNFVWVNQKVRLFGINTPEIRNRDKAEKEKGLMIRDFLSGMVLNKEIILKSHKDKSGKFGRKLGTIFLDGININMLLIENGMAKIY